MRRPEVNTHVELTSYMIDIKDFIKRVYNKLYIPVYKRRMSHCGEDVHFSPCDSVFTYESLSVGNHVSIGYHADFVATRSKIVIGDHVIFGPHVSIRGGDHRFDIPGRYIDSIKDDEKLPENDADVVFEGDNWIGMNSTILKGVTVGFGSIIAAGSVVTHSIPPYSVAGGVPARVIRNRFNDDDLSLHESLQYSGQSQDKDK
jgi:maltose O-acetyltransferase